jgi:Porin subfamily
MADRLRSLALSTALGLCIVAPAKAQSVDELKAMVLKLQQRVEQLEANQRVVPQPQKARPAPARPTSVAQSPSTAQLKAAQQAAGQARKSAAEAQQAAAQAEQNAAQAKDTAAAEVKAAFAPPPGKPGGSFRIPGTETVMRAYGFMKLNGSDDLTTFNPSDALSPQSIPLFGTAAQRQGGGSQMSARRSRFDLETWTPVNGAYGDFHTLLEIDFAGQNTSLTTQATTSGYTPRLRKAYADFGKPVGGWGAVLVGQETTVFGDNPLLPIQWLNDLTFVGVSNVRQAQVRYTYGFGGGLTGAFGVEAPYSDITTTTGTSFPDSNGGSGIGWQYSPDFTGRLVWKQRWGLLALRGLVRPQIDLNNEGASATSAQFNKSTSGFGVGLTGVVNLLDGRLVLMASGNAGDGIGRYLDSTSNGYGAVSNAGVPGVASNTVSINAPGTYGGMVGLQYFFTPTIRTNMSIGGARIILPSYTSQFGGCVGASSATGTCSSTNSSEASGTINFIWSPFKAIDLGVEYEYVERHLQAPFAAATSATTTGGIENRILVSAIARY